MASQACAESLGREAQREGVGVGCPFLGPARPPWVGFLLHAGCSLGF